MDYLPILSGIAPAHLRRDLQMVKLAKKCDVSGSLIPPPTAYEEQRIPRNPHQPSWIDNRWSEQWRASTSYLREFIDCKL
jgi:hypothetical protein